jgi:hypothetical protein
MQKELSNPYDKNTKRSTLFSYAFQFLMKKAQPLLTIEPFLWVMKASTY